MNLSRKNNLDFATFNVCIATNLYILQHECW